MPEQLQFQLRQYYKRLLTHKTAFNESQILEELTPQLRHELSEFLTNDVSTPRLFDSARARPSMLRVSAAGFMAA